MKMNNYAVADDYKSKIVIPYIGIEFKGWLSVIGAFILLITIILVIGFPLSLLLGSNAFFLSFGLAVIVIFIVVSYSNEINNETGRTRISEFYYVKIKRYRMVYDSYGEKRYLGRKKKGVVYIAHR